MGKVINDLSARVAELERENAHYQRLHKHQQYYPHPVRTTRELELEWRVLYLENKLQRQTAAIRSIQKVGWQPTRIIKEVPYPDDEHLWDEPPPQSERRPKRRPSVIIQGV